MSDTTLDETPLEPRCEDRNLHGPGYLVRILAVRRAECGPARSVLESSWRQAQFCALDFETTGLNLRKDEVVSFGAVTIAEGRIQAASARYRIVRPDRPVSPESIACHAIRPQDLVNAPRFEDCLDELVELLAGRVLIAHAAWIELALLRRALKHRRLRPAKLVVDTSRLAMAAGLPAPPAGRVIGLEHLAALMGLPGHTPHHALGDALTTAEVFLALVGRLEAGSAAMTAGALCRTSTAV